MSQSPDTKDYVLIFNENYFEENYNKYCEKCGEKYTNKQYKWCKPCQIEYFKSNFTIWTSGDKQIDNFI
jgi:hypothetical protein